MAIERTFSIIKPDATKRNLTGAINAKIEAAGLRIVAQKRVKWKLADAKKFYAVHAKRPFFKDLVKFMASGPIVVQVLEGNNAVAKYREIMGATNPKDAAPGTIRKDYAESIDANSVHGSDSADNAKKEIKQNFKAKENRRLMNKLARVILSVGAYVAFIVLVNLLFIPQNLIEGVTQFTTNTWMGTLYLANVIVGFVFVLRDYAQREIGHKVLIATALAGIPVWYFAGPELAAASLIAFMLSEMTDWAVYTFTKRPLQSRIFLSALFSVPVDTLAFQHLAGYLTPAAFVTEVVSKAIGVVAVWYLLKLRVGNAEAAQTA